MRIQQFQVSLVDNTRKQLPRKLRNFDARSFFSIVKLHLRVYSDRVILCR